MMARAHNGVKPPKQPRQNQQNLHRPKLLTCFNIFFALSILEAISLIAVSFGSEQLKLLGDSSWFLEMAEELFFWDAVGGSGARNSEDDVIELEDDLAVRKEKEIQNELDDDNLLQAEKNQAATTNITVREKIILDNYSKRPHIPNNIPIPLIVGGSDGSGTRAFVDVLGRLGVPMLVDDRGTMDIHAQEMFKGGGWPPLVQLVISALHTANYSLEDLPTNTTSAAMAQVGLLASKLQLRSDRLRALAQSKKSEHTLAKGVKFGFKAPVSMLVIPLLLKHYGKIRFLHVVRDGRDVALSANQSPVQKFYRHYYDNPDKQMLSFKNFSENDPKSSLATSKKNLMAMQLWNDWNTQVHDWEQQYSDGKTFDYLVMRTEDLLDPDTKFHALQQLADFVGSPKTKQEICCMSRRAVVDMGASGGGGGLHRGRFAHVVRNRITGLSREERIEALKKYRASRAVSVGALPKSGVFRKESGVSVPLRGSKASTVAPPKRRVINTPGTSGVSLHRQTRTRRSDADGVGIPILENDASAPIGNSEAEVRKDARISTLTASQNDAATRITEQLLNRMQQKVGIANAGESRRRLMFDFFKSSTEGSVESFKNEFLEWKGQFARVRLDPAKYAEEALSRGDKMLKKYALSSQKKTGSEMDVRARLDLERQMRAPMAHLAKLVEQVHSGKFKAVHERYGKWAKILAHRPEMSKLMHSEGKLGLSRFGYEPQAEFMDFRETDFTCDASVVCDA